MVNQHRHVVLIPSNPYPLTTPKPISATPHRLSPCLAGHHVTPSRDPGSWFVPGGIIRFTLADVWMADQGEGTRKDGEWSGVVHA